MTNLTVSKTILEQLGGNKFIVMTGAKEFIGSDTTLSFKIGRNSAQVNRVRIELTPMDTYKVTFFNISVRKTGIVNKVINETTDVYCDQLQELFTRVTGMYTRL